MASTKIERRVLRPEPAAARPGQSSTLAGSARAIDGERIVLTDTNTHIRLNGVDAPAVAHPGYDHDDRTVLSSPDLRAGEAYQFRLERNVIVVLNGVAAKAQKRSPRKGSHTPTPKSLSRPPQRLCLVKNGKKCGLGATMQLDLTEPGRNEDCGSCFHGGVSRISVSSSRYARRSSSDGSIPSVTENAVLNQASDRTIAEGNFSL
jgi:hypothetical protein